MHSSTDSNKTEQKSHVVLRPDGKLHVAGSVFDRWKLCNIASRVYVWQSNSLPQQISYGLPISPLEAGSHGQHYTHAYIQAEIRCSDCGPEHSAAFKLCKHAVTQWPAWLNNSTQIKNSISLLHCLKDTILYVKVGLWCRSAAGVWGGGEWRQWRGGTVRQSGPHAIFGFCQKQQNPLS